MALAPQNEQTFFREVDDELRRDRMETFLARKGKWLALFVALFLAAVGGWLYWQHRQTVVAGQDSEVLSQALTDLGDGRPVAGKPALDKLAASSSDEYRATALLTRAAAAQMAGDRKGAIAGFAAVIDDKSVPNAMRDAALVRRIAAEYDTLAPAKVIERLKPIAVKGNPWFGSAGEMLAVAYLRTGRQTEAGQILAAIANDPAQPASLRARASRVTGSLGVDTISISGEGAR